MVIISPHSQKRKMKVMCNWQPPNPISVSLTAQLCGADRSYQDGMGVEWSQENREEIEKKRRYQGSWKSSEKDPSLQEEQVGYLEVGLSTHSPSLNTLLTQNESMFF